MMKLTRCKLLKKYQCRLLEFFVLEATARSAADLLGIQPNTAALFYHKIRQVIAAQLEQQAEEIFGGEVELDESYFGGARKGRRGRGAAGKVYTKVIQDTKTNTLMPIIRNKIAPDSIVYTDSYHSYNALGVSEFHHFRINHSTHFAEEKTNHINGIENFWYQAKRVLRKYNVIPKQNFHLFLKECEFRFNFGTPKTATRNPQKMALLTDLSTTAPNLILLSTRSSVIHSDHG